MPSLKAKMLWGALAVFVLAFLFTPQPANAQSVAVFQFFSKVFSLFGATNPFEGCNLNPVCAIKALPEALILAVFGSFALLANLIFQGIASIIQWITTGLMNIPVAPGASGVVPTVRIGWEISRNLVNSLLLLVVVFIGLATILRWRSYELQRTLPVFILMAVLVNFSGVFVGLVVDIANLLANFFLTAVKNLDWKIEWPGDDSPVGSHLVQNIAFFLGQIVFFWIASLIYLSIVLVFFLRLFMLWALAILAPLAFGAFILPATRRFWNMWLSSLLQWAFVVVPISFAMYLAGSALNISGKEVLPAGSPGVIAAFLGPAVALFLLAIGVALSMSLAPGSVRGAVRFGRRAAAVGAGFLGAYAIMKAAENKTIRGRIEGAATSAGPTWGKDEQGRDKRTPWAWAQRRAAGLVGYTQRGVGKLGMQAVVEQEEKRSQKAGRKAQGQNVIQNLSDLRQAGTPAERREILRAMIAKRQLRDAGNADIVGKNNVLKAGEIQRAYRNSLRVRDVDTAEALERNMIRNKQAMQAFAQMQAEMTVNAENQYEDRAGDGSTVRHTVTGEVLPAGVTSEEYDNGVDSFQKKVIAGTTSAEEIGQLQGNWFREGDLTEAALEFWAGNQMQQAGVRFGREFLNAIESGKNEKGLQWFMEPTARGKSGETGAGDTIYRPRNTAFPRWTMNTLAQNLGVSPLEGARRTQDVNDQARLANLWSRHYGELEQEYGILQDILESQRQLEEARSGLDVVSDQGEHANLQNIINRVGQQKGAQFNALNAKMRTFRDQDIQRLWTETNRILGSRIRGQQQDGQQPREQEGDEDEEGGETPRRRGPRPIAGGSGEEPVPEGWTEGPEGPSGPLVIPPERPRRGRRQTPPEEGR